MLHRRPFVHIEPLLDPLRIRGLLTEQVFT
jgi:hypothetical protein